MLRTKNIVYGFCSYTTPKKPKYLISRYRLTPENYKKIFDKVLSEYYS